MQTLSVSDYLALVNETLALIPSEAHLIEGEVSDYRVSQGKWVTFTLKDEEKDAVLPCFGTTFQLTLPLENGMRVQVKGYSRVYERFGKFSLNVREVEPVGEGALRKAYEMLKRKLEAEGLFDASRKRTLPRFPSRVGLITSREAAAYTDFLRIANNRFGGSVISLVPVHVQGQYAVEEILSAFAYFDALEVEVRPELIVLTRGGGSLEDLHAFNDERVARAVFGSAVPVVVGVGHERDESLADFAADVRASTPSNAAELVFPDRTQIVYELTTSTDLMESRLRQALDERSAVVSHAGHAMTVFFERLSHVVFDLATRLSRAYQECLLRMGESVVHAEQILRQVDPKRVLSRGYSLVKVGGVLIKDTSRLEIGTDVQVQLARGLFSAEVTEL
ncbi:TPA: exodeoxyribonuclease VII large subunit [Candidatus Uhrbacteria bacterium]|nr:MAG: Exodeoxyribonuclease 7 large subunit [Parcubacteria group bacterium GW2011_GWA2_53_21]OGL72062.1 MAG: exodeoxyribonuclease VII large subunit [Candidatus Uhrbacteria bacterium RIFCSPHIGHO2_02_FULL_54_11]HBL39614.1 exodeoxyribonuclease VII large subunit [Candidatus Uhrbacteria bacterium]